MTTDTTHPGDRDPGADPADEWDRETTPGQQLATAMRTAVAARRDLAVLVDTRAYLAGPMTGYPEFNFPAFQAAAHELRLMGIGEIRHTGHGTPPKPVDAKPWEAYLRDALRSMLTCDAVVTLPGWRESKGARLEVYVALELGMPVVEYPDLRPVEFIGISLPDGAPFPAPPDINWDKTVPYPATQGGLDVIPEGTEYAASTAEYLDRRYGGNDPRRMFEDTIDLPKDEEPARKGRPMPDRPQA